MLDRVSLMPGLAAWTTLLGVIALVGGCATNGQGAGGDCNSRIGFQDTVYRPHNALNQKAPTGRSLGTGAELDCDGSTVGRDKVFAITGVDPTVAIRVKGSAHGIYVAEGLPRTAWPTPLKRR